MAITIDPSNLPRELFAVSTARVRAGKGPVRVTPTELVSGGLLYATAGGRGKAHLYSKGDLFATKAEAELECVRIARRELEWEIKKHREIVSRLNLVIQS